MERFLSAVWSVISAIISAVLRICFRIIGKELTEDKLNAFLQFVKFCIVGLSNTAISLGIYYIFVTVNKELYIVGNIVGFVVSVLNSYFWNSRFVFKKKDETAKVLVKTFMAYGTNLVLGTALLYLFVDIIGISEYIAPLINLVLTVPLNFLLNKFWVMKG